MMGSKALSCVGSPAAFAFLSIAKVRCRTSVEAVIFFETLKARGMTTPVIARMKNKVNALKIQTLWRILLSQRRTGGADAMTDALMRAYEQSNGMWMVDFA